MQAQNKSIYLRKFTMDEADLLFVDGDADVMKYITHGLRRTMDDKKSQCPGFS